MLGVSLEEAAEEARSCICAYYRLNWLKVIFMRQRAKSGFDCATRTYMLLLVGCTIFTDKTFTLVEEKYLSLFRDLPGCGRYYLEILPFILTSSLWGIPLRYRHKCFILILF